MKNREVFQQDPTENILLNDGVANIGESDPRTIQHELRTFVCEGEYLRGLSNILQGYLAYVEKPEQPAVWVSGFYGSGKSHLVKMLRFLWTDHKFADQSTARGLARLPQEINDALKELSVKGRQNAGLRAAAGTFGTSSSTALQLAVLRIVFGSLGLPEEYPAARLVLRLKQEGVWERVKGKLEAAGKQVDRELRNMYVSGALAEAILEAQPKIAKSPADVLSLLKNNYPKPGEISTDEMVGMLREALTENRKLPCMVIVVDEIQQYIGEDAQRSYAVQEIAEAISKRFDGKLVLVGTGQAALASTPQLARLKGRFTRTVTLSDKDVETVIRQLVLAKQPAKEAAIKKELDECQGEISRHLVGTKIEPRPEDRQVLVADYPLLPVRQRFWELILRTFDTGVLSGQLRTQLRISLEAARKLADEPLGHVVPADFIFDQISQDLVQRGLLDRQMQNQLLKLREKEPTAARLCALIFLINKLRREPEADAGLRANVDTLADLLVSDLKAGSAELRKEIADVLGRLATQGILLKVDAEYHLQTEESIKWEGEYQKQLSKALADEGRIAQDRTDMIRREVGDLLKEVRVQQGRSKERREPDISFANDRPMAENAVPIWVRNGWEDTENSVLADARKEGTDSALVTVFLPKRAPEDLKRAIATLRAAEDTLTERGNPTTEAGQQARAAMQSRADSARETIKTIFRSQVLGGARVILGGGTEVPGSTLPGMMKEASESALARLFPEFGTADHERWGEVIRRVKDGSPNALEAVGHHGTPEKHPVCEAILKLIPTWKKGAEIRKHFAGKPYGWSRDAVDGALLVLMAAGHVKARHNGQELKKGQFDQTKSGVAEFCAETKTLTAQQRVVLRSLYQDVDIRCQSGEEVTRAAEYLEKLVQLANAAGGAAPLPPRPGTTHLEELQRLTGNEQAVAVFEQKDRLKAETTDWRSRAALLKERNRRWQTLQGLLQHAAGVDGADDIREQAEAIGTEGKLLATPDPVPPLCKKLAQLMRDGLVSAYNEYSQRHAQENQKLEASEAWRKITPEQRRGIAETRTLDLAKSPVVGTEEEVVSAAQARSVETWATLRDALPGRFQAALFDAARLLEPKVERVNLPGATIRTEKELDEWLAAVRDRVASKLKDGPVIV